MNFCGQLWYHVGNIRSSSSKRDVNFVFSHRIKCLVFGHGRSVILEVLIWSPEDNGGLTRGDGGLLRLCALQQ